MTSIPEPTTMQRLISGAKGQCPHCRKGKLFRSYLKQVDSCSECYESLGHIRADDGPAWLTILVVGHLILPFLVHVETTHQPPLWLSMTAWPTLALVLVLVLLPIAKGIFISLIYKLECEGANPLKQPNNHLPK